MAATPALFITGTDTGVGKTTVGVALISAWRAQGKRVTPQKPAESGCARDGAGKLCPLDAVMLADAAQVGHLLDDVCPFRYEAPLAPAVAARQEGRPVTVREVLSARDRLAVAAPHDLLLVEGAGGLMVPFNDDLTAIGLAQVLGARLLIVGRAGLGTINHTVLTAMAARAAGLDVVGIILSRTGRATDPAEAANPSEIERLSGERVWGVMPHVAPHHPEEAAQALAGAVDLGALWAAASAPW